MAFIFNRSKKEPMSEINVTPFVDVMLVLLIIFMVTAPLLTVGVPVDLPKVKGSALTDQKDPLEIMKFYHPNLKKLRQNYLHLNQNSFLIHKLLTKNQLQENLA